MKQLYRVRVEMVVRAADKPDAEDFVLHAIQADYLAEEDDILPGISAVAEEIHDESS